MPRSPSWPCPRKISRRCSRAATQSAANKKLVFDMWRTFLTAHHIDEADKYLAPEYHQHNPNADTGLAGVKAYFRR